MAFVSSWPDLEATVFDPATVLSARTALRTLRCPFVIAADETSAVRATFTNTGDRETSFLVRTRISRGLVTLPRQDSRVLTLAPRETVQLSWPVTAADAAYRRIVLARVFAAGSATSPPRQMSCGILVVGVRGISGQRLFYAGVLASLAALALGGGSWAALHRPLRGRDEALARAFGVMVLTVLGSLAAGVLGWWLLSHLLLVLAVLLVGVLLERFLSQ